MKHGRPVRTAVVLVAVLLGLLGVVQLRSQTPDDSLSRLSNQDLTLLIGNLATRNDELRAELTAVSAEAGRLAGDQATGSSSIDALTRELVQTRGWAGLEPLVGSGVQVVIGGPLDAQSVGTLLDELANAGAEALVVDGIRVVPGTVVHGNPGNLIVGGRSLAESFPILAIGDPGVLTAALTRGGGLITQLSATWPETEISVAPRLDLRAPATMRNLLPNLASPVP